MSLPFVVAVLVRWRVAAPEAGRAIEDHPAAGGAPRIPRGARTTPNAEPEYCRGDDRRSARTGPREEAGRRSARKPRMPCVGHVPLQSSFDSAGMIHAHGQKCRDDLHRRRAPAGRHRQHQPGLPGQRLLDLGIFATHASPSPTTSPPWSPPSGTPGPPAGGAGALRRPGSHRGRPHPRGRRRALGRPAGASTRTCSRRSARFASRGFTMSDSNRKQALLPAGSHRHPLLGHRSRLHAGARGDPGRRPARRPLGAQGDVGRAPSSRGWPTAAAPAPATRCGASATFGIGESMPPRGWRTSPGAAPTWRSARGPASRPHHHPARPGHARGRPAAGRAGGQGPRGPRRAGVRRRRPGAARRSPGGLLLERGLTVAVAESCTGGLVGKRLHRRPGQQRLLPGRRDRLRQRREDATCSASRRACWPSTAR